MSSVRATMFFEWGKRGWSETLVKDGITVDAAIPFAEALLDQRNLLLASDVTSGVVRLSDPDVFRDSRLIDFPTSGSAGKWGGQVGDVEQCALLRLESGTRYRKAEFMHGLDRDVVKQDNELTILDPTFRNLAVGYGRYLIAQQWGFLARDVAPPGKVAGNAFGDIFAIILDVASGRYKVITNLPHNLVPGDKVIIRGVKGCKAFNGVHLVTFPVGTPATEFFLVGVVDTRTYEGGGVFRRFKTIAVQGDRASVHKEVAHHRVGRPSDLTRGRRSTPRP